MDWAVQLDNTAETVQWFERMKPIKRSRDSKSWNYLVGPVIRTHKTISFGDSKPRNQLIAPVIRNLETSQTVQRYYLTKPFEWTNDSVLQNHLFGPLIRSREAICRVIRSYETA